MHQGKVVLLLLTSLMAQGCEQEASGEPHQGRVAPTAHADAQGGEGMATNPGKDGLEIPADACTLEGYWSFFEAFVRSPKMRRVHTASGLRDVVEPFRISLVDDRWVYAGPGAKGDELLDLQERRQGRRFEVEYIRATFDEADEVVSTEGSRASYTFEHADGCWRLIAAANDQG